LPTVPARLALAAPAKATLTPAAPPATPAAPAHSYPLTPVSVKHPLAGVNRPVSSILQELATREKLKVIIGPTADKTLTLRFNDVEPERALGRVAQMAGLAHRKHEGVWYVATPEWIAQAFPEQRYNQVVQLPTEDAAVLASALQKVLGNGTKVEAVGKNSLVVRAPLAAIETTSQLLAQWPTDKESKSSLVSSIALDLPDGADESMFRMASFTGKDGVTLERTRDRSFLLQGDPMAVLSGLKNYVAEVNRARLTNTTVARRLEKQR
jgi:type II secretory pathway component GspD/PulD (secretin)